MSCFVKCDGGSVYPSWRRPYKFIELCVVVEFYLMETTFIFLNKSSCCCSDNPTFSLVCISYLHPLKDYPRNRSSYKIVIKVYSSIMHEMFGILTVSGLYHSTMNCNQWHIIFNPFAPEPPITARADPGPFYPL